MVAQTKNGKTKPKIYAPKKLSLACGQRKPEGYFGIDLIKTEDVDLQHDLLDFPWPIKTNSVTDIECQHFVEHIPHWRPGWEKNGWWLFFDEIYRICKKGAYVNILHPYCMSGRAFYDPTHERYIHEVTWIYLSKEWRVREQLDHYPTDVNFEIVTIDGTGISEDILNRNDEQQLFMRNHYWNVVADIQVTLRVIK